MHESLDRNPDHPRSGKKDSGHPKAPPPSEGGAPKPVWIGAHTSAAGGVHNALYEGHSIGATTIQLFTSNQRQWHGRSFSSEELALWEEALEKTGIRHVMSHDSYLINLGSPVPENLQKSRQTFQQEIERCRQLKIPYLNFHPGSATGSSEEECIQTIIESLLSFESLLEKGPTRLLIESTAGQGTQVGYCFEHLAAIIAGVSKKLPIGVCIDTCHIFAAGYDLRTEEATLQTIQTFDQVVGLRHLYAFHLNDSLKKLNSRVDRHANLGEGEIGLDCFRTLMSSHNTYDLPKYLETPNGSLKWEQEIALLKDYATQKN